MLNFQPVYYEWLDLSWKYPFNKYPLINVLAKVTPKL